MTPIIIPTPVFTHSCSNLSGPIPWYGCLILTPILIGLALILGWVIYDIWSDDWYDWSVFFKFSATLVLAPICIATLMISIAIWF